MHMSGHSQKISEVTQTTLGLAQSSRLVLEIYTELFTEDRFVLGISLS